MSRKRNREEQRARQESRATNTARELRAPPDWPLVVVAAAGMVLTALLLASHSDVSSLPYCSEGSGCGAVQNSAWSRFLGIPLPLWGFGAYALIALVALGVRTRATRWRWSTLFATAGLGISIYLTIVSVWIIEATCVYCLASLALMAIAFALGFRRTESTARASWRGAGLGAAAVLAALMHADAQGIFGGTGGAADPYLRELAEHLDERGFRFYGASWCPHCQQQKELFGGAARFLPYVECSPHGRNAPRATDCEAADIRNYPTWIIDGRPMERVLTTRTLARLSGFRDRGDPGRSGADGG